MTGKWLRVGAFGMAVVLAGCASAPPKPAAEAQALEEPSVQAPVECGTQTPAGDGVARLSRAVGYGALGVFVGALQGANDGVGWALWTGASRSDGAWIGAAAGAGVGFVIGFVAGLAKAGSRWSAELATPQTCPQALAEPTASMEDN